MEVVIPRTVDSEPAPRTANGERYAPFFPQSIGMLAAAEAAEFSLPFSWDEIETEGYRMNDHGDTVYLGFTTGDNQGSHRYMVPDGLERFVPAIHHIGMFERNHFPFDAPWAIKLTLRQSEVVAGKSQHTGTRRQLHIDSPYGSADRFYVLSDHSPTQFFGHLYRTTVQQELPIGSHSPDFVPKRYEIAGASASMYHRSPPVRSDIRRTFLRLTYKYDLRN